MSGLMTPGSGKSESGDPKADGGGRMAKAGKPATSDFPGEGGIDGGGAGTNIKNSKAKSFC